MSASKSAAPIADQVMKTILKETGIVDYDPEVIKQMVDFTYRHVTNILGVARLVSTHSDKSGVDVDDVRLAIQKQADTSFTSPPPRDLLMELASQRNSTPLPSIRADIGTRLPPDRHSLTACNYHLKPTMKSRKRKRSLLLNGSSMHENSISGPPQTSSSSMPTVTPANSDPHVWAIPTIPAVWAVSRATSGLAPVGGVRPT